MDTDGPCRCTLLYPFDAELVRSIRRRYCGPSTVRESVVQGSTGQSTIGSEGREDVYRGGDTLLVPGRDRSSAESLALALIVEFEGFSSAAYWDVTRWSIGYGTTADEGDIISKEGALLAAYDHIQPIIRYIQKNAPDAAAHEVAALVSFAYNVGLGGLKRSSVWRYYRDGNIEAAAKALRKWVRADGKTVKGLVTRRIVEGEILMGTVHLLNEKRIQKWAEEKAKKPMALEERIRNIKHSEQSMRRLMEELELDSRKVQKKD